MFRNITAAALALLLTACGSIPARIALEPATKQNLKEVKVLSVLGQDEVIVRAEAFGASAALGGGLIGAVIDSKVAESRQNTLQDLMAPFYQSVDDYDFRTRFEQALAAALKENTPVKFAPLERSALIPMQRDITSHVAALPAGSGQMYVFTTYNFTGDFGRLDVKTYVEMKMPGVDVPVFKNTYTYQSRQSGAVHADSIKAWSNNTGASYRATMDEAVSELVKMLQLDLAASAAEPKAADKFNVSVLASSATRKITRDAIGNLLSEPIY